MIRKRTSRKRSRKKLYKVDEPESVVHQRPIGPKSMVISANLAFLQKQIGNQAVQRMLNQGRLGAEAQVQRQVEAEDPEKLAKIPVEVGEVTVEAPKIEYYDVQADSLADLLEQAQEKKDWQQEQYEYALKAEEGVVTEVNVTVVPILKLPRWTGPGWDAAADVEKLEWLKILESLGIEEYEYEDVNNLPSSLVGLNWETAPDVLKNQWQVMLQTMHGEELRHLDIIHRRVLTLQRRLFKQPEAEAKARFDQFLKDLKIEEMAYHKEEMFGQQEKISLGVDLMVK